ncbi:MAG: glycoside hydrolase family 3 protein [Acidobacteria bacterium]|nr:glycoside hydrolase family 3 protein [Acidobacteriota bacterium]
MRRLTCSGAVLILLASLSLAQAPSPDSPSIEQKVNAIVAKMTLEQKIDLLGGVHNFDVRGYPELGLPPLYTADGPLGVRNDGPATAMAGGISLASTWDPEVAERVGSELGRDARAKGKHFLLGPGVNIYRAPLNGRNFEYFGEDPFLGSQIAVAYIRGVQSQGVAATIKHFVGNNSEFDRHNADSVIDERSLREIYLPIFEAAVKEAHVAAVMDAYNLTNGEHMTENSRINNDILKKEWGFAGILMSDWDSTYDTAAAANGGLDLEMPSGKFLNREKLLPAIKAGAVSEETINDKVRRIVRTELEFGWPDRSQQDLSVPRYNQPAREVALQAAREGIVLLKNDRNLLPLGNSRITRLALIGPNVYPPVPVGGGSAQVVPFHAVSLLEALGEYLRSRTSVTSARGPMTLGKAAMATNFQQEESGSASGLKFETFSNGDVSGRPSSAGTRPHVILGTPFDLSTVNFEEIDLRSGSPSSDRWTGYYVPKSSGSFDIFVQQGGFSPSGFRMYLDNQRIFDNWENQKFVVAQTRVDLDAKPHKVVFEYHSGAGFGEPFVRMGIVRQGEWLDSTAEALAEKADTVVVCVGFDPQSETEGWDRTFELPPGQNELIRRIAAKNRHTIVIVNSGGGIDMTPWIDQVDAVIEAWYPGQEGGRALQEILFGDVNPSGHLPATFERRWEDNPTHGSYYPAAGTNKVIYKEGVFLGYRGYEHNGSKPLFPFGYGLSYTTFKYSNLTSGPKEVSFQVTNTGTRAGDAVAQVYIAPPNSTGSSAPPRPAKELKGFSRTALSPGQTKTVTIPLNTRSFAYYDVNTKQWRVDEGVYKVLVGSSSQQIELTGQIRIAAEAGER